MAGIELIDSVNFNNNSSNTTVFRNYIKDNLESVKKSCLVVEVTGRSGGRFKANNHGLWLEFGLDPRYCLIADFINGIDGDTDIDTLNTLYLPDGRYLDSIAQRVNR